MIEREAGGGAVRGTTSIMRRLLNFFSGSSKCPLFLLAKAGWRRGIILATAALKILGREVTWLGTEIKKLSM